MLELYLSSKKYTIINKKKLNFKNLLQQLNLTQIN